MMASTPLVSVIICAYNAGGYLNASLESIMRQRYQALEILLVDDGSTDGSIEGASDLIRSDNRIRLIRQENKGKPGAMNTALAMMRGELYVLQDADDISDERRIAAQVECMVRHPDIAAVFCGYDVNLDGVRMAPIMQAKDVEECRQDISALRMPGHDPTAMYRWSMVQDLRYEVDLLQAEGYDYILRVGERSPMMVLGECLYSYRIHMQSLTKRDPSIREKMVDMARQRAKARRGMSEEALSNYQRVLRGNRARDNNLAAHFMDSVCSQKQHGRLGGAFRAGLQCARLHPGDLHYWKAFAYAAMPVPLMQRIRSRHATAV